MGTCVASPRDSLEQEEPMVGLVCVGGAAFALLFFFFCFAGITRCWCLALPTTRCSVPLSGPVWVGGGVGKGERR